MDKQLVAIEIPTSNSITIDGVLRHKFQGVVLDKILCYHNQYFATHKYMINIIKDENGNKFETPILKQINPDYIKRILY